MKEHEQKIIDRLKGFSDDIAKEPKGKPRRKNALDRALDDIQLIKDLAMLVERMAHKLSAADHGKELSEKAINFLRRKNLISSILRDEQKETPK